MAAARDGFARSIAHVEVAAPNTHRVDFLLAADYPPVREAKSSPATAAPAMPAMEEELEALKKRIGELEVALKARAANAAPANASAPESAAPTAPAAAAAPPATDPVPQQPVVPAAPPSIPEALQSPEPSPTPDNETPFAFADFSWLNGNPRNNPVLDTKFFTPEVRFDTHFMTDFNQPRDHTMGGATESFRSGEFQVEQISVGGDFHWQQRARQNPDHVWTVCHHDAAQRRQRRRRPMGRPKRLQICFRGLGRIPLQRESWIERRRRNFRVLYRPVQLLQLR